MNKASRSEWEYTTVETQEQYIERLLRELYVLERAICEMSCRHTQTAETLTRAQAEGTRLIAENMQLRETIHTLTEK